MSGEIADRVRFGELWDWRTLRVWGGAAAAVLGLWFAFIVVFPRQFGASVQRYALPLGDTPPPGRAVLKLTPDADVTVPEGGNLDVALEVSVARQPAAGQAAGHRLAGTRQFHPAGAKRRGKHCDDAGRK